jgi:hypothetical protein
MDRSGDASLSSDNRTLRKGRVVDASGRPALVAIIWGSTPTPDIGRRTNDEGTFQVGLGPGRYRLRAVTQEAAGEVEVEGSQSEEILLQIRPL